MPTPGRSGLVIGVVGNVTDTGKTNEVLGVTFRQLRATQLQFECVGPQRLVLEHPLSAIDAIVCAAATASLGAVCRS